MNRLDICETCQNKSFDIKKGIICGLTNEKPTFQDTCPDYKENLKVSVKKTVLKDTEVNRRLNNIDKKVAILWGWFIVSMVLLGIFIVLSLFLLIF